MATETSEKEADPNYIGGFRWYHWLLVLFFTISGAVGGISGGLTTILAGAIGATLGGFLMVVVGRGLWHAIF